MIKVKHFMDAIEPDDGQRIWVEPVKLTLDLQEWCKVDRVMSHIGPPVQLWRWFDQHQDAYAYFRSRYHETLANSPSRDQLMEIASAARRQTFTLLHSGDDAVHNTAVALHEFLSELEAYCPPEV